MPNLSQAPLLVFIGFMGAGKSTIGRLLAARFDCAFVDLDHAIAQVHGPVPDIFSRMGESGFRAIEHHHLNLLLPGLPRPAVLSLGGGAYMQSANRELLAQHGATVIFLDAPFELIASRLAASPVDRPLARDPQLLRRLYDQRRPIYQQANYTFASTPDDPAALVNALVRLVEELASSRPERGTL